VSRLKPIKHSSYIVNLEIVLIEKKINKTKSKYLLSMYYISDAFA
jgi:hypothetical protein